MGLYVSCVVAASLTCPPTRPLGAGRAGVTQDRYRQQKPRMQQPRPFAHPSPLTFLRFACTGVGWGTASACSEHYLVAALTCLAAWPVHCLSRLHDLLRASLYRFSSVLAGSGKSAPCPCVGVLACYRVVFKFSTWSALERTDCLYTRRPHPAPGRFALR